MSEGSLRPPEFGLPAEREHNLPSSPEGPGEHVESREDRSVEFARSRSEDAQHRSALVKETRRTVLEALRQKVKSGKLLTALAVSTVLATLASNYEHFEEDVTVGTGVLLKQTGEDISAIGADELGFALERSGRELIEGEGFDERYATLTDNKVFDEATAKELAALNAKVELVYATHAAGYANPRTETYRGGESDFAARNRLRTTELSVPRTIYAEFDGRVGDKVGQHIKTTDKYGNEINAWVLPGSGAVDSSYRPKVRAVVDLDTEDAIFSKAKMWDDVGSESAYSVSVDLSAFGGPELKRVVEGWALRPVNKLTNGVVEYPVYVVAETRQERINEGMNLFSDSADAIANEIAGTEAIFGLNAGEAVKRVVVTGQAAEGAHINATYNERTVTLPSEWVPDAESDEPPEDAKSEIVEVARHETLHAADHQLGLSQGMREIHASTTAALFEAINESQFLYGGTSHAGHAESNERELFASLFTGLMATDKQWNDGVGRMAPDIRRQYQELLTSVRKVIVANQALTDAGHVKSLLDRHQEMLASIISAGGGTAVANR